MFHPSLQLLIVTKAELSGVILDAFLSNYVFPYDEPKEDDPITHSLNLKDLVLLLLSQQDTCSS